MTPVADFTKAAQNGRIDRIEKMLKDGMDINVQDEMGMTALMYAVYFYEMETVKFITKDCKADVNIQDNDGDTAMHYAVDSSLDCVVALLLENGAETDIVNKKGVTALQLARKRGQTKIVELMEKQNKDPRAEKRKKLEKLAESLRKTTPKRHNLAVEFARLRKENPLSKDPQNNTKVRQSLRKYFKDAER